MVATSLSGLWYRMARWAVPCVATAMVIAGGSAAAAGSPLAPWLDEFRAEAATPLHSGAISGPTCAERNAAEARTPEAVAGAFRLEPVRTPADSELRDTIRGVFTGVAARDPIFMAVMRGARAERLSPERAGRAAVVVASPGAFDSSASSPSGPPPINHRGKTVYAAPVRYFEDFENAARGREWTDARMPFERRGKFGRFAGPFRQASQTVNLAVQPGVSYVLSWDLYRLGAVTGAFRVEFDGVAIYDTTFETIDAENRAANGNKKRFDPDIARGVQAVFRAQTEIAEIRFVGEAETFDAAWGLDNVQVEEIPEQPLSEFGGGGGGVLAGAGGWRGAPGGSPPPFTNRDDYRSGAGGGDSGGGGDRRRHPPPAPVPAPGAGMIGAIAIAAAASRRRRDRARAKPRFIRTSS